MSRAIRPSVFLIRLRNWEYWPVYISNIPVILYWLYFALRSRSLFFFSVVNPAIETGGVMGESKINILNQFPQESIPISLFFKANTQVAEVLKQVEQAGISYPLIVKPNVGERGFLVEKIPSEKALLAYLKLIKVDFLIQQFIDLPMEISVMYYRFPDKKQGKITSICVKKNLSVVGDGKRNVEQLMYQDPRAILQIDRFRREKPEILIQVPSPDENLLLEPVGNHSRGTMFLNGNAYITEALRERFDSLADHFTDIYYGRFDLKCASIEQLEKGKEYKVLEFNGVASEPAHIYDPAYPVWKAYRDIYQHWKVIYAISKQQRQKGLKPMSLKEARQSLKKYFTYLRYAREQVEKARTPPVTST